MDTPDLTVELRTHTGLPFEPITTNSGKTLQSAREAELWHDGYEQALIEAEEDFEEDGESGNGSGIRAERRKTYIVLSKVRSMLPDFKIPTRRNGEELLPSSVTVRGQFIMVRYFGWEPVEGPRADNFFLDVFYNSDGSEIFRVQSKIVEAPPDPPTFVERLRYAFWILLGSPQD
jgi:hypothetical protein